MIKYIGYAIFAIILLATVAWVANSFPRKSVVDDVIKDREIEIKAEYEKQINERDNAIVILKKNIEEKNSKIVILDKELQNLRQKRLAIKEPKTLQEIIEVLKTLGYNPIIIYQ